VAAVHREPRRAIGVRTRRHVGCEGSPQEVLVNKLSIAVMTGMVSTFVLFGAACAVGDEETPDLPPADQAALTTSAHHLYVAPNGSDSNPGTQAAPFRTILKASQAAVADTTVHVAPGTYSGSFQTTKSGTATGRIIYVSTTRYAAKIVPPSSSSLKYAWDNRGAYVTIDGFEVDGSVNPTSGTRWTVGIGVGGTGDIVTNCLVHHIYSTGTGNSAGGAGILLDSWYGFNNMQALANVVHHVGPPNSGGAWYHGIYQTATGEIKNNVVYANAGGGIHLWHDANHINVANNTSFGNGIGYICGGGDYVHTTGPADYITFTNNIAFDNTGMGFDEEGQDGPHNVFSNNLSYQNGTNWRLEHSTHTNDVTANPQFVNYIRTGGGDYHLKSTSPAINKGLATYAPVTDFDGKTRTAPVDLGAFELATACTAPTMSQPSAGAMTATQGLNAGHEVRSTDGRFTLVEQTDGNIVLYGPGGSVLWSAYTSGTGNYLIMQSDGNLVQYSACGQALWNSGTWTHAGAQLAIQNDGNLVIYHSSCAGGVCWSSGTGGH
jgi:hypothetical protein